MTDTTILSLKSARRRRWPRVLAWIAMILVVLVVVVYFVATSSAFIRGVILPRASAAIGADITVTDISVHPFSSVTMHGLKVQTKGQEPIVTAPEIRLSYSLWSILGGNLRVYEVAVVSPTVMLVENPDGVSNLDALLKATAAKPGAAKTPQPAKTSSAKPPQVDLRKVTLSNATVWKIKNYAGGQRDILGVTNVNLELADVKNGQAGKLQLEAGIQLDNNPPAGASGHLQATVNVKYDFTLNAELKPAPLTGQARVEVPHADGGFGDLSGFSAVLDCNVTPMEIKQVLLHFQRNGTPLGELSVSGPLDMEKLEGKLRVELRGIDRRLLNLASSATGIDFGTTAISSSNEIDLSKGGTVISATGRFDAGQVQLSRAGQTMPSLDINASYDVMVDSAAQAALLRTLTLSGTQNGKPLLNARLSQPMNVVWGKGSGAGDSALDLAVTDLNLADWKPFLGNAIASGNINTTVKLASQQGGKQLGLSLDTQIRNLVTGSGASQMTLASGNIAWTGQVSQKPDAQIVTGKLVLANFTGQSGPTSFRDIGCTMDLDVNKTPEQIVINKVAGKLTQGGAAGGSFELTGKYDTAKGSAQLTATLVDFNQTGLRPFLEPMLGDKKLVSIAINGNASVEYDPRGNSDIKAKVQVANLVVNDPLHQIPATPLEVKVEVDTTLQKQSASIRQFQISLSPTKRGKNQVQMQGQVDFSQSKAIQGSLKLSAESIDVTSYYDLFAGGPKAAGTPAQAAPAPAPPQTGTAATGQEPPPMNLPLKDFTLAVDIGKFYLREIEITHWQTTVKVDGGQVLVKPFQLALNGAPVNATVDLNLGVPGYKYDVAFGADHIPAAPFVDSFAPERKGQVGGTLTSHAQIIGAGITDASLQQNLNGMFNVGITNLNLSVVNVKSPILKKLINVIATIPELLVNPQNAIAGLMGTVTGSGGGLMEALEKSPIQVINAQVKMGGGRIDLQQSSVQSLAFMVNAAGGIKLARVLTNSTINIPVTIAVNQPIARQLNLAAGSAPANATYVPLPQFLTMKGTVGVPKADINKAALGGLAVKSIGTGLMNTATNTGSTLGGFLNSLLKKK